MGYDVSYHPIKEEEIQNWYFDAIDNNKLITKLATAHNMDEFYVQKYKDTLAVAPKTLATEFFDNTHGLYIAVVQGFFRTYYYTRGSAFSFLIDEKPEFKNYTKPWQEIVKTKINNPIKNKITDNYSAGIFIPADKVQQLLSDYKTDQNVKNELDNFYSHQRISVFLKALTFAQENNMGLLEATEVVEPNPMDLNSSTSYSNLFNCDKEGVYLYQDAALEQIREVEQMNNMESGEISKNAAYVKTQVEEVKEKEKKGFWKKLFG